MLSTEVHIDRCLIIHGCPPSETNVLPKEKRWMFWLGQQLQAMGIDALALEMPTSWAPKYEEWKAEFEKHEVTSQTVLVGHSCGGAFLVRWLLETKKVVKKLILVSPAKVPESDSDMRVDLYDFELPDPGQAHIAKEIVIFISNDLPHNMKSFELYKNALNPRVIHLENKVHFLIFTMGTVEFPELLEEVLAT